MSSSLTPTSEKAATGPVRRFVAELTRRKVHQTAFFYVVGAYGVVEATDLLSGIITLPDWATRLVLGLAVAGFPIVIALSWALELTPPQLRREASAEDVATAMRLAEAEKRELRPDTVGVLPFENLSDDPANAYFSEGITEDVMMSLAQVRGLRVIPRETVSRYREDTRSAKAIASELGAATLVMGSVRRDGSRVRVVTKVVDAATEDHLWTESYDRELEDIFQVQSEIAAKVGRAVQIELSSADRERIEIRGTNDAEAYDLYLRARFLWNQRSEGSVAESVRYFQRALERDPGFALAHSGLADAYTVLGIYGIREPREVLEAARAAAETALSIDPELGEAVATRACVTAIYDWDWPAAEGEFGRALEIAPSYATAHQWYAMNVLAPQGRFEDAREQLELARELDPASSAIATSRGIVAFYARDMGSAATEFETVAQRHPRFSLVHYFLGQCYGLSGEPERAIESLRTAVDLADESSETLAALGHALASGGHAQEAEGILRRLCERAERAYVSPALMAQVLVGLGRPEEALDRLEEATELRATDLVWLRVRPVYDPLKGHPRFAALLERLGFNRA